MIPLSQRDPEWKNDLVGTGNQTINDVGCFLTSLSMIKGVEPPVTNEILKVGSAYLNGNMIVSWTAAEALGLSYEGVSYQEPDDMCIAETNHYSSVGVPQHFFIYHQGDIIDPLDLNPEWKTNTYNIVSYRLFSNPKEMEIHHETIMFLKSIWKELSDENKNKTEALANKHRKVQSAMGLEVTPK